MKHLAAMITILLSTVSVAEAATVDCNNVTVKQLIDGSSGTTLVVESDTCGSATLCLDSAANYMTQTRSNRIYTHVLSSYLTAKPLLRLSFDNATAVSGCGYLLVIEVR